MTRTLIAFLAGLLLISAARSDTPPSLTAERRQRSSTTRVQRAHCCDPSRLAGPARSVPSPSPAARSALSARPAAIP